MNFSNIYIFSALISALWAFPVQCVQATEPPTVQQMLEMDPVKICSIPQEQLDRFKPDFDEKKIPDLCKNQMLPEMIKYAELSQKFYEEEKAKHPEWERDRAKWEKDMKAHNGVPCENLYLTILYHYRSAIKRKQEICEKIANDQNALKRCNFETECIKGINANYNKDIKEAENYINELKGHRELVQARAAVLEKTNAVINADLAKMPKIDQVGGAPAGQPPQNVAGQPAGTGISGPRAEVLKAALAESSRPLDLGNNLNKFFTTEQSHTASTLQGIRMQANAFNEIMTGRQSLGTSSTLAEETKLADKGKPDFKESSSEKQKEESMASGPKVTGFKVNNSQGLEDGKTKASISVLDSEHFAPIKSKSISIEDTGLKSGTIGKTGEQPGLLAKLSGIKMPSLSDELRKKFGDKTPSGKDASPETTAEEKAANKKSIAEAFDGAWKSDDQHFDANGKRVGFAMSSSETDQEIERIKQHLDFEAGRKVASLHEQDMLAGIGDLNANLFLRVHDSLQKCSKNSCIKSKK